MKLQLQTNNPLFREFYTRLWVSLGIAFLLSFIVFVIPLKMHFQAEQENYFLNDLKLKAVSNEHILSNYVSMAESLGSRTVIRQKLFDYHQGKTSLEELSLFTGPKFADGASVLKDVVGAARYLPDGTCIATWGNPHARGRHGEKHPGLSLMKDNEDLLAIVVAPITEKNILIGYDVCVFNANVLLENRSHYIESLDIVKKDDTIGLHKRHHYVPLFSDMYLLTGEPAKNIAKESVVKALLYAFIYTFIYSCVVCCVSYFALFRFFKNVIGALHREKTELGAAERRLENALMELHEKEAFQRALLESLPVGVMMVEPETRSIEQVNEHAAALLGASMNAIVGQRCHTFVDPSEEKACSIGELGQDVDHAEGVLVRPDGTTLPILKTVKRVSLAGKEKYLECFVDISERKQAEEALKRSEANLRTITESAQDAIIRIDARGEITFWNPAAERILGYASWEALGRDVHELLAPERFQSAFEPAFLEFQRTGRGAAIGKTVELTARRKDGVEIPVALSLSAMFVDGEWHALGILRDVSEQKRIEAELRETNRQLEKAIARANAMALEAEMASQAKSEFLANMSHEIRTPLNGVIGMTGLLLDTELTEQQRHYAKAIKSSGEALLGIINDILDFSKIEAGKLELEIVPFDLGSFLEDFAVSLAVKAHEKGLEFTCAADPDVPLGVRGDPGRLRQVLTNLVGNALKFTHEGEVLVRVSRLGTPDGPETSMPSSQKAASKPCLLRFSVRDTGIGIPSDKVHHIFDKFTQVDASTTRRYGGTGLGLAICKRLVELMGGHIGVESTPGKGSEFWFTVPFEPVTDAHWQPASSPPPVELSGVRVLVIDDNATNREILVSRLRSWNMRAEAAQDGPTGLQALYRGLDQGDPFRLAIVDMQMPGMDGEALARAVKADSRLKETRLVLLTSLGSPWNAERLQALGFSGYAVKPVRQEELKEVLTRALGCGPEGIPMTFAKRKAVRPIAPVLGHRRARILVAEDNIINQQVALGLLEKLGCTADAVANGQEALEALKALPYDLVLMDVQMPEMDGLEAARRIRDPRSSIPNRHIPIIAMTAHAMEGDKQKCLDAGMNDYITKPVSLQALVQVLEKWLPHTTGSPIEDNEARSSEVHGSQKEKPEESIPVMWNREGFLERLFNDEVLVVKILEAFLADMPQRMQLLRTSLKAGDLAMAVNHAHAIKGAAANVGAEHLSAMALAMEQAGKAGDLEGMKAQIEALFDAYETLKTAVTAAGYGLF